MVFHKVSSKEEGRAKSCCREGREALEPVLRSSWTDSSMCSTSPPTNMEALTSVGQDPLLQRATSWTTPKIAPHLLRCLPSSIDQELKPLAASPSSKIQKCVRDIFEPPLVTAESISKGTNLCGLLPSADARGLPLLMLLLLLLLAVLSPLQLASLSFSRVQTHSCRVRGMAQTPLAPPAGGNVCTQQRRRCMVESRSSS
mmetsp:Transcript_116560/g.293157  ORF Transcript_116560/g.293157 Transcript_116560/m.293157 type:complete len:200 (-) Transcript_116560:629-1228(-)